MSKEICPATRPLVYLRQTTLVNALVSTLHCGQMDITDVEDR